MDADCKLIIALTETGTAARVLAQYRPKCPILAVSASVSAMRQMNVVRGVVPFPVESFAGTDSVIAKAMAKAKADGMVAAGDAVVCIHGQNEHAGREGPVDEGPKSAASNLLKIVTVP